MNENKKLSDFQQHTCEPGEGGHSLALRTGAFRKLVLLCWQQIPATIYLRHHPGPAVPEAPSPAEPAHGSWPAPWGFADEMRWTPTPGPAEQLPPGSRGGEHWRSTLTPEGSGTGSSRKNGQTGLSLAQVSRWHPDKAQGGKGEIDSVGAQLSTKSGAHRVLRDSPSDFDSPREPISLQVHRSPSEIWFSRCELVLWIPNLIKCQVTDGQSKHHRNTNPTPLHCITWAEWGTMPNSWESTSNTAFCCLVTSCGKVSFGCGWRAVPSLRAPTIHDHGGHVATSHTCRLINSSLDTFNCKYFRLCFPRWWPPHPCKRAPEKC